MDEERSVVCDDCEVVVVASRRDDLPMGTSWEMELPEGWVRKDGQILCPTCASK